MRGAKSSGGYHEIRSGGLDVIYETNRVVLKGQLPAGVFKVGSWVELLPGDAWPGPEARPSTLIGRVCSQTPSSVVLDVLARQSGVEDRASLIRVWNDVPRRDLTKKLLFPLDSKPISSGTDRVKVRVDDTNFSGEEVYGVYDVSKGGAGRLGGHLVALAQPDYESMTETDIVMVRKAGKMPSSAAYVLLDAVKETKFDVHVVFYGGEASKMLTAANSLAAGGVPGMKKITFETREKVPTDEEIRSDLGGRLSTTIEIRVVPCSSGYCIHDQMLRMNDMPWRVVSEKNTSFAALGAVVTGLQTLGYYGSSIYLLEQAWSSSGSVRDRAALAPTLAWSYLAVYRRDLAYGVAETLKEMRAGASEKEKVQAEISIAAITTIMGSDEAKSADLYKISDKKMANLSSAWKRLMTYALGYSEDMKINKDAVALTNALNTSGDWHEYDDMRLCMRARTTDIGPFVESICLRGYQAAASPFEKMWFAVVVETLSVTWEKMPEYMELLDTVGVPFLEIMMWTQMESDHLDVMHFLMSLENLVLRYIAAHQPRQALKLMFGVSNFIYEKNLFDDVENDKTQQMALKLYRLLINELSPLIAALDSRMDLAVLSHKKFNVPMSIENALANIQVGEIMSLSIGDSAMLRLMRQTRVLYIQSLEKEQPWEKKEK